MYSIIGGDGKEYGPVSANQIREWMASGRANLSTKVKLVGTDTWRAIAEVPEISGSASAPEIVPAAAATPATAGTLAELDIMSCYGRSWDLLKANFWPLVGVNFLIFVISGLLLGADRHGTFFLGGIFGKVFAGGLFYYFLLKIRGQPATLGDAFAGFTRAFLNLLVIGLLVPLFVAVGFVCIIIPGVYLLVAYSLATPLAVDKRIGFWDAMETSRQVVTRNWWRMFGLLLLGIPIMILGMLALGVGIFVAAPVCVGAVAYAYEDLFNSGK
jgi:GYF domain 2